MCLVGPGRDPTVMDFVLEDVTAGSRRVKGGWFSLFNSTPPPIFARIEGPKRGIEHNRRHDMFRGPGVATRLRGILRLRMYQRGQVG